MDKHVLRLLFCLATWIACVRCKQVFHVQTDDRHKINKDVVLDNVQNTLLETVGAVPTNERYIRTINFHDYTTGYNAFKHIDSGKCYVCYTGETYPTKDEIQVFRHGIAPVTGHIYLTVNKASTDLGNLIDVIGRKIPEFCHGYTSYMLTSSSIHNFHRTRINGADSDTHQVRLSCLKVTVNLEFQ